MASKAGDQWPDLLSEALVIGALSLEPGNCPMRVLFVEKQIDYEPLGLLYLSSVLRQAGHEVRLAIAADEDPVAVARAWQPDVVGYSVYTGSQTYYRDLNLRIKEAVPDVVSVFGGPHPTYFPEYVEEPGVDAVCIGEGEGAMLDLVEALEAGRPLTGIENWWFKDATDRDRAQPGPPGRRTTWTPCPSPTASCCSTRTPSPGRAASSTLSPAGAVPTTAPTASTTPWPRSIAARASACAR